VPARILSTATVLVLLAASAVAFALTEGAKLERSPIAGTRVDPLFSPESTANPAAHIRFRVRSAERLEVWIERDGNRVRTLLTPRNVRRGSSLDLVWNGLSDNAIAQPDGVYMPVVKLFRSHRTIVLPSPIRIDTHAPAISVRHPQYPIVSPDGDGHHDAFRVTYHLDEAAHAILLEGNAPARQVVFTRGQRLAGQLVWTGREQGHAPRPGRYVLSISAQDRAGNRSKPYPFAIAQVRYVVLARTRVVVRPGGRFALRVSTDAPTVQWTLHGRSGTQRAGTLHFRAPKRAGVYRLYVSAAGHAARCAVVVA